MRIDHNTMFSLQDEYNPSPVNYWFYNTDANAFGGRSASQRLIKRGFAVTGGAQKFGDLLAKLDTGDTLLMYENMVGVLAVGTIVKRWDGKAHENTWYYGPNEPHEYRIATDWYLDFTADPIDYKVLRDAVGYTPRGALRRDLNRHAEIETLISEYATESHIPAEHKTKPGRLATTTMRIVRDTGLSRTVKRLHDFRCQMCGNRLGLPDGRYYAEAHHIRPLGKPHDGVDTLSNLLCVCPNHHAALDFHAIRIDVKRLRTVPRHKVDSAAVKAHNLRCDARGLDK